MACKVLYKYRTYYILMVLHWLGPINWPSSYEQILKGRTSGVKAFENPGKLLVIACEVVINPSLARPIGLS